MVLPGCKSWGKFWQVYTPGEAKALYSNAQLWNDYIVADGSALAVRGVSTGAASGVSTRLNASGSPCLSTATGGYGTCIHAGLMRQSVINDKEDCTDMAATDALGVFIWVCDASVKPVRLISVGLNEGKHLSDLVDFDAVAWRANSLTVTVNGVEYRSPATVWWSNAVATLTTGGVYGTTSGIYLIQSNLTPASIFAAGADKTALVMKPGVKISTTGVAAVVNNSSRHFTWYEGAIDMNGTNAAAIGFATGAGGYMVLSNFSIANSSGTASRSFQIGGSNGFYRDVRFANALVQSHISFELTAAASGNVLQGIMTSNDEFPMRVTGAQNNIVLNMTSANNGTNAGANVYVDISAGNNGILNFTSANGKVNGSVGPLRVSSGANNTLMNLGFANTTDRGVVIAGGTGTQILNVAAHRNVLGGVDILSTLNVFAYFTGIVKVTDGTSCTGANPDPGLVAGNSVACAIANASDFTVTNTSMNPVSSFVGKVVSDDAGNSSDAAGLAVYTVPNDWLRFENRHRGYGLDGNAFANADHQGRCAAGNCRIWDWSLRASDSEYRAVLPIPSGNSTLSHKWSAGTQVNCTQPGAVWYSTGTCNFPPFLGTAGTCAAWTGGTTATAACLTTFLRNAYEIVGDSIGNENGLCESNEACIYTPNIASYQGHGALSCIRGPAEYGCASSFVDGTISGVVLYQYATNGY